MVNGGEFLLQAHDDSEMNHWVSTIKAQCVAPGSSEGKSMTMPSSSQKEETKKKSFFTLKKK